MNYTTKIKLIEKSRLPTKSEYSEMSVAQREYFENNLKIEQLNKLMNNLKTPNYLQDLLPIEPTSEQDTFELIFTLPFPCHTLGDLVSVDFTLKGNLSQLNTKPKFKFDIFNIFNDDCTCEIQDGDFQKIEIELQKLFKTWALDEGFKWGMGVSSYHMPSKELKIDWNLSQKYQEIVEKNLSQAFKNKKEINLSVIYDGIEDLKYGNYGFTPPESIRPIETKTTKIKF